ncbi:MAG: RES family NAD+ phosphorylase [Spirochaetaceae bacterium]|nr:RES family NAD+ phosphorylase [Spirochaetaceae bacterium]
MASRHETVRYAYRIVSSRYPPFDGAGAYRWGSRWVSPGRQVVHSAETYALAVLENLVHWQSGTLPSDLVCVRIAIPRDVAQEQADEIDPALLLADDYRATRRIGDAWHDRGATALLWVPSAVSPYESNVLCNQRHADFSRIIVGEPTPARVDARLSYRR